MGFLLSSLSLVFVLVPWGGWFHRAVACDLFGPCRRLKFSTKIDGHALHFHVIKTFRLSVYAGPSVRSACTHRCIMDPVCVSVNIGPPTDEKFICELSDSDHMKHPEDVKKREGYLYIGTENPCFSNPCRRDSICMNGYTDKQYLCKCQAGYTGEQCEKDINESTIKIHNCSLHAICNNTEGSFNCSCKDGFSGDGINCTDIDECAMKIHNCSVQEICSNTEGSFNCSSKDKPQGNGNSFTAVFTNLGASGRIGPTILGSNYTGQDHDGQVTLSSGIQLWTVPYTGDYRIEAVGAAGGYDTGNHSAQYRGRGARMIGTFSLSQGEIIHILIGQEGGINKERYGSGGGGGTFVVRGSNTPLTIAGGGGGLTLVSTRHARCDANTSTTGNPGYKSWSGGSNGHGANTSDKGFSGGGGGGFYSSGRSGTNFGGTKGYGGEGGKGFLQGGVGGRAKYFNVDGGFGGGGGSEGHVAGGGGGGYSGGSSGAGFSNSCGGGGGSYNVGVNQQNECCFNTAGHGNVTITKL